jgi:hypothetical protein
MRKMPAVSNGGQETRASVEDEEACAPSSGCSVFTTTARAGGHCPADDDGLLDEETTEQALLELMVALTQSDEGDTRDWTGENARLITQRIIEREAELRAAFAEHIQRLRQGAKSVPVCVFDCSTSETKRICPPTTAYLITGRGATFMHYRREVLADLREGQGSEILELRLADIFSQKVCNTRLKWAGPTMRLVRHVSSDDATEPQFEAQLEVCDERPCTQEVLHVMLKSHHGGYARALMQPGCAASPLKGSALPDSWNEVLLGFAVGDGTGGNGPSLYRRRLPKRDAPAAYPPTERQMDVPSTYYREAMATRVAEC